MSSLTYIYVLVDPVTNENRYVGKTKDPYKRLISHLSEARQYKNHNYKKEEWTRSFLSKHLKPTIKVLGVADSKKGECWEELEKHWIQYGRDNGWNLFNISDGGLEPKINKQYKQVLKKKRRSKIPDDLLGTMPDWELAEKLELKTSTVKQRRMSLKIPPLQYRDNYEWDDFSISLLGTMQDMNLARKLRISTACIKNKREELGIPHYRTFDYENQKPRVINNPRTNYNSVREKDYPLLGTMTDKDLADLLGVHHATVQTCRRRLGVPSYRNRIGQKRKERIGSHKRKPSKIDESLLGTMPDKELAKMLGLTTGTIKNRRIKLRIPNYKTARE